ncbi:phage tail protein [Lysinibacillus irui]|uniref:phage tail protein n=1 Tax=Lysinibacillus irui TaxID=2998077 RepID=UPI002AD46266|nr:phage tail protein [Lysinibacillus irui]MEA0565530.1 phage tail protein [Lysinibacillus irui]
MIEINVLQIERLNQIFRDTPEQIPIVLSRAINESVQAGRTQASREARSKYTVRHGDVLKTLKINRANRGNLYASISSKGELIPLIAFNPRQTKKGVSVAVKKGERKQLKSLFLTTLTNPRYSGSATNVFGRVSAERYPLRGHYGPSIPQMIENDESMASVEGRISEVLYDRTRHGIDFLLRG